MYSKSYRNLSTIFCFLLVFTITINHVIGQRKSNKAKTISKCDEKEFEKNFDKLLVINSPERDYPEDNKRGLKKFCNETNVLFGKIAEYRNQCLKETLKNFVSIITYSMKTAMKRICGKPNHPRTVELINASPCINRNKALIGKCFDEGGSKYSAIKLVDNALKMPHICCNFVDMLQCFSKVMIDNGCEKELPILLDNITNVIGNFLDSTCGEYNIDSDKCEKLPPLAKNVKPYSKNYITNLVDVFANI